MKEVLTEREIIKRWEENFEDVGDGKVKIGREKWERRTYPLMDG